MGLYLDWIGQLTVAAMAVLVAVAPLRSSLVCRVVFGGVVGLDLAVAAMAVLAMKDSAAVACC